MPSKPRRPASSHHKGRHPPTFQVAALCWRRSRKGLRILLVTSRDSGRWVIPKGWPMRRRSMPDAAAREAWEEAGVKGEIRPVSLGLYTYRKVLDNGDTIPCAVVVYPLEVQIMLREYPEYGQRSTRWFSPRKAAKRVREPQLASLIRDFDPALAGVTAESPAIFDADDTPEGQAAPGPEPLPSEPRTRADAGTTVPEVQEPPGPEPSLSEPSPSESGP